jgi:2-dehydropantoate 2-reductase
MNIVMVGRGVIASIYGKAFTDAGHAVRHLARPGRSAALRGPMEFDLLDGREREGAAGRGSISVYSADCFEKTEELEGADLAFACVRAEQMKGLATQLRAAPKPKLGIVFFNNCWDDTAELAAGLPPEKVLWAFPMGGGGFIGRDRLECALQDSIHMESAEVANAALGRRVAELFVSLGIKATRHGDMRAWLWRHYAINAGFLAMTLSRRVGMAQAMDSPSDLSLGLELVREATRVVEARGIDRKSEAGESSLARLPLWLARGILKSVYRSSAIVRRMMNIDGDMARLADAPRRVLAEARRLGLDCPRLEAAAAKIETGAPLA